MLLLNISPSEPLLEEPGMYDSVDGSSFRSRVVPMVSVGSNGFSECVERNDKEEKGEDSEEDPSP